MWVHLPESPLHRIAGKTARNMHFMGGIWYQNGAHIDALCLHDEEGINFHIKSQCSAWEKWFCGLEVPSDGAKFNCHFDLSSFHLMFEPLWAVGWKNESNSSFTSSIHSLSLSMSKTHARGLTPHPSLGISASAKTVKCKCESLSEDSEEGIKIRNAGC